ncbi:hypothetical protein J2125_001141 [Erwinia toletana]|uniref:Uncharacterized protein n=1 Tax=Winslowiella toletana TaxID=92490 RepID=A0ABS4P5R8_9GAMM|nr:hypothetical protein [Winslowiella toletana]
MIQTDMPFIFNKVSTSVSIDSIPKIIIDSSFSWGTILSVFFCWCYTCFDCLACAKEKFSTR